MNSKSFERIVDRVYCDDPTLTILDLYGMGIGNKGAKRLAKALANNTNVCELWLRNNNIGPKGVAALTDTLKDNICIFKVSLSDNKLGDKGTEYIASALMKNSTITHVGLENNRIRTQGARSLVEVLAHHNDTVKTIDLKGNEIKDAAVAVKLSKILTSRQDSERLFDSFVARIMDDDETFTNINLDGKTIESEEAEKLAAALAVNTNVQTLSLCNCRIDDDDVMQIASALEQNMSISALWLGDNDIGPVGAEHIALALADNSSIMEIGIENNQIGCKGAAAILDVLRHNDTIKAIHINGNGIQNKKYISDINSIAVSRVDNEKRAVFDVDPSTFEPAEVLGSNEDSDDAFSSDSSMKFLSSPVLQSCKQEMQTIPDESSENVCHGDIPSGPLKEESSSPRTERRLAQDTTGESILKKTAKSLNSHCHSNVTIETEISGSCNESIVLSSSSDGKNVADGGVVGSKNQSAFATKVPSRSRRFVSNLGSMVGSCYQAASGSPKYHQMLE